jgi:hypothetical protein
MVVDYTVSRTVLGEVKCGGRARVAGAFVVKCGRNRPERRRAPFRPSQT